MRRVALIGIVILIVAALIWVLASRPEPRLVPQSDSLPQSAPLEPVVLDAVLDSSAPVDAAGSPSRSAISGTVSPATDSTKLESLSGELWIPLSWNARNPEVLARSVGWTVTGPFDGEDQNDTHRELKHFGKTPDFQMYRWQINGLPPGPYEVWSADPPFVVRATLAVGGTANVRIEVPQPSRMFVHVVDAQTSEAVQIDGVTWFPMRQDGSISSLGIEAKRDKGTKLHVLVCPPGDCRLRCLGGDYEDMRARTTIQAGENHFTFRLAKAPKIRIVPTDDAGPVVLPRSQFDVQEVVGDGYAMEIENKTGAGVVLKLAHAGRYRVKMKEPAPGFLLPNEQIVDFAPGTMTDVVIRLTRKP